MCVVFATAVMVIGTAHARTMRVREAGLWRPTRSVAGKVMGGIPSIWPGASAAIQAVTALKDRLGISADADTLRVRLSDTDRFGRMHVRLQQLYKGLEVDGRELIVHFGADGWRWLAQRWSSIVRATVLLLRDSRGNYAKGRAIRSSMLGRAR